MLEMEHYCIYSQMDLVTYLITSTSSAASNPAGRISEAVSHAGLILCYFVICPSALVEKAM